MIKRIAIGNRVTGMVITALLLLFNSCESVLFIELEESDKLIVLNGALSNDSTLAVQVSRTRHILDNAPLVPLEQAVVKVYQGSTMTEQLKYSGNGFFRSAGFIPAIGEPYRIEVENPGYPAASASVNIPEPVKILTLDTATVITESQDLYYYSTEEVFRFDISIDDPPGEDNFYLLDLFADRSHAEPRDTTVHYIDSIYYSGQWNYFVADSTLLLFDIYRYQDRPRLMTSDIIAEAHTNEGILFSDQLIDGKHYSIRAETSLYNLTSADSAVVDIRLHSISESYYKYLKSRQKHYDARDNYLAVPVIVFTNVEGGTGFLGGYSSDVRTITTFIPEYYWDRRYFDYGEPVPY